jgi:hypothetical protein
MRCVLAAVGDPPFYFVQIVENEKTLYSQRIQHPDDAPLVADDFRRTFIDDPH